MVEFSRRLSLSTRSTSISDENYEKLNLQKCYDPDHKIKTICIHVSVITIIILMDLSAVFPSDDKSINARWRNSVPSNLVFQAELE